jgi:O-glycosyl hydrolase
MQSALGKYLVGFYNVILQQTGVRLYGISLQNEADFPEPYISCVYTTSEYRDALKAVGRRFADAGISVKLFGAEDMLTALPSRAYIGTINADAQAKPYLGAVAVHGYVDGVNPIPSSGAAQAWARLGQVSKAMGIGAWMTESSGFATDWGGAMQLAMSLYTALRYGNLSLWTFWADGATSGCNEYSLLCDGDHTTRSLVSKNFYRYIRPGAVRIGSAVSDSTCFVVAFNRSADSTLTLVVYNENSGYQLNLAGANLPSQLSKYVTTSSKACVAEGTVGSSGIAIEASSVTTLVGRNYRPALSAVGQPSGVSGQRSGQRIPSTSVYTLNGALLCRAGDLRGGLPATAGVRVRVSGRAAAPALVWGPGR